MSPAGQQGSASHEFRRVYAAVPPSVAVVREALRTFASDQGAARQTIDAVALAASEAATNIVLHAYRESTEPGTITVQAQRDGRELRIIISDTGLGLKPRTDSPGLGLGLALITTMADDIAFGRTDTGGLEVRMIFLIDQAPA